MTTRRDFFRKSALVLPALLVGDAALEAYERLTHRKVWALGGCQHSFSEQDLRNILLDAYRPSPPERFSSSVNDAWKKWRTYPT